MKPAKTIAFRGRGRRKPRNRAGASALDYMLVLGIIVPCLIFLMWAGPKIMSMVYEMDSVLVSWPFM
jgi:hypothetical protein